MSDVRQPFAFGPNLMYSGKVPAFIFLRIVDALIFSIFTSSDSLSINLSFISAPCLKMLSEVMIAHDLQVTIFLWRYFFLGIARMVQPKPDQKPDQNANIRKRAYKNHKKTNNIFIDRILHQNDVVLLLGIGRLRLHLDGAADKFLQRRQTGAFFVQQLLHDLW